jgi:CheY-like chemotaxis protein
MKRILVVEDDRKIASALVIRLEAAGYEVLTANDGLEGLDLVLDQKPDLIIMDIWMPVGVGFSVAQRLRALGFGSIPIIFITASKIKGLKRAASKVGAVGFFEKPYEPEQLLCAVSKTLAARGSGAPLKTLSFATRKAEVCHEKNTDRRG